jgi:hypothetical protein
MLRKHPDTLDFVFIILTSLSANYYNIRIIERAITKNHKAQVGADDDIQELWQPRLFVQLT